MGSSLTAEKRKRINYNLLFRRLHKWLALVVGIQLILWTLSGFIMSYVPIEEVHGDHLWHKTAKPAALSPGGQAFEMGDILARFSAERVVSLRLFQRAGRATYAVQLEEKTVFVDGMTGQEVDPLTEAEAIAVAQKSYRGTGTFGSVEYVIDPEEYGEIRGRPLPIWKVNFTDDVNTSLYVSPLAAQVITVRSDIWRQYDFFWMLHIMDYDTRDNFNTPLLILVASLALFVSLSGLILVFYAFSRRDFRWLRR